MTEKEFRKLVSDVEVSRQTKEQMDEVISNIQTLLTSYENRHYEIVEMCRGGSFAKGTMLNYTTDIDALVVIKPTINKIFGLTSKVIISEIVNALIVKIDSVTKVSDIVVNDHQIIFKYNDYTVKLIVVYNEEKEEIPSNLLKQVEINRNKFVELANRDYTYFKNTVQIIKFYRDEQKITIISGMIIETLLYYALKEYCFDTRYEDYLNAFIRGLDDFIMNKKIEVPEKMYQELGLTPLNEVKKGYTIIDVGTGSINLTSDVNEIKLGEYRKLKKAIAKLVDTKSVKDVGTGEVKLNVTPQKNSDGTYSWCYKIEDTSLIGMGGTYSASDEDTYTAIYKALLKGFKAVIDNNLNRRNVKIICPKQDILTSDQGLSNENNARRKNVLTFIENNNITIAK